MYCEPVLKKKEQLLLCIQRKTKPVVTHSIILEDVCSSSAGIVSFALPNSWSFSSTNELTASFGGLFELSVLAMVGSLIGFTFPH